MSREIILLADVISREKGVEMESVVKAIESALAAATRKQIAPGADITVSIDDNGKQTTMRNWTVVTEEENDNPDAQMLVDEARKYFHDETLGVGDVISEEIDNLDLGRIGATMAKQIIIQRLKEAEREQMVKDFTERDEKVVYGTIKRNNRGGFVVEIGKLEAFLPKEQTIPKENLRIGDKVRAAVLRVERSGEGPRVVLSRISPEFLYGLFENEVPELADGDVEIKGIARDPGNRAKIAVFSKNSRHDPVGTFVGMRGMRVQNVTNELAGERIDIIRWNEDLAQMTLSALAPAEVAGLVIDEEKHVIEVVVDGDNLPLAIGRNGQNVRLASQLVGWEINIVSTEDSQRRNQMERDTAVATFVKNLDVDQELAELLADEGFNTLEEVAYVPIAEMLDIEGLDEDIVNELRNRARDVLTREAIEIEERVGDVLSTVMNLKGMEKAHAVKLLDAGIKTRDDVGELDTEEYATITGATEETAAQVIMDARSYW